MPHVTVSRHTHERIGRHAIRGFVDPKHFHVNPNGTVTFWVDEKTKARLDEISPDVEAAIIWALDVYEGRKSGN